MLLEDLERLCPLIRYHQLLSAKCQSFVAGLLHRNVEGGIQIGIHITDCVQIDVYRCGHERAFQWFWTKLDILVTIFYLGLRKECFTLF